jgi:hypothetical protein
MACVQIADGQGKKGTIWDWMMSDSDWIINPLSFDAADPNVRRLRLDLGLEPDELEFVDPGDTQGERATAIQIFNMLDKQQERKIAAWRHGQAHMVILKAFLINPLLFDNDTIEFTRGPVTQYLTDPLHVVFARLTEHLSVLDAVSYKQIKVIYEEQWHGSTITYLIQELERSNHLYANGMPMSSEEKLRLIMCLVTTSLS